MGAEASRPKPGANVQVIGAGLPRTGTASFAAALQILLKGPVYHGGTQIVVNDDDGPIKSWIEVLARTPYKSPSDREFAVGEIRRLTEGFVATADSPMAQYVEELMELYPEAKVICTVRDPDAWAKSIDETAQSSLQAMLAVIVFWVPVISYFPRYIQRIQGGRWGELYSKPGEKWSYGKDVWERHMAYLERTVPKAKLVYFDVRDGWEPLCRALNVQVPSGVEFPKINDGKAIDQFVKKQIRRGLLRWAVVLGTLAGSGWIARRLI